jgi:hypothetical protein
MDDVVQSVNDLYYTHRKLFVDIIFIDNSISRFQPSLARDRIFNLEISYAWFMIHDSWFLIHCCSVLLFCCSDACINQAIVHQEYMMNFCESLSCNNKIKLCFWPLEYFQLIYDYHLNSFVHWYSWMNEEQQQFLSVVNLTIMNIRKWIMIILMKFW